MVFVVWVSVALLTVPFYLFSQQELAPAEDQGVVFSALQTSANSTLDQTRIFAEQVADVYRSFPEAAGIFQLTYPTSGFGGFVTKPWSERTKTTSELLTEVGAPWRRFRAFERFRCFPRRSPAAVISRWTW